MRKQNKVPNENSLRKTGLVVDQFLDVIELMRKCYKLVFSETESAKILQSPGTAGVIRGIIQKAIEWHGADFSSTAHPLLDELGPGVLGESVKTSGLPRQRVSPASVEKVLQYMLLLGLQTVHRLPSRDPKDPNARKQLTSLARALSRLTERIEAAQVNPEAHWRIDQVLEAQPETPRMWKVCEEMRAAAEVLKSAAECKVKRTLTDSPNPQVRWALSLIYWVENCTGAPHYAEMQTLFAAAFDAAGKECPKWVDRLGIEMHGKRTRRKKWVRTISS